VCAPIRELLALMRASRRRGHLEVLALGRGRRVRSAGLRGGCDDDDDAAATAETLVKRDGA